MSKKRSRIQCLRDGDKNTRFFHTRATSQNKRNNLLRLKCEDNRWVDNENDVHGLVSTYFSNLFRSSSPQECDLIVEDIDQSLTENDILALEKHVTTKEVYDALMQMSPSKAPGPDGVLPTNTNKTLITLIPKVSKPESLKDMHPISLCNVLYKIISKVLVNDLKLGTNYKFVRDPNKTPDSSQRPPPNCPNCGDAVDGLYCQRCTCESCGNGAHYGYNCPPKVSIISNPEPCYNQIVDEFPQTLPTFAISKIPICYDDDDDEYSFATQEYLKKFSSAITPDLPKSDSLIMEDKHFDTIPETESDELIKSSVEDLVHTP
ncbi:hypothetical protein Tco_0813368, partial [Tanacetum coccineum]